MIKLKLFSESIELQASQVANQYPFIATITYAGKLSDGVVGGTEGIEGGPYRVLITAELLRKKIKSLVGKSVLITQGLNNHTHNFKVGTFKQAWVEAATLPDGTTALAAKASGLIEETEENKDIIEQIIDEARAEKLGFSYDIKDVRFHLKASTDSSSDQYVEVADFEWRGATILRRDAAAYEETRLAASKTTPLRKDQDDMTPEQIRDAIAPLISPLQTSINTIQTEQASQKAELQALKAAGTPKVEENKDEGKDLATALVAGLAEANKPLLEAITKTLEAVTSKKAEDESKEGVRKTLRFTGSEFKNKYKFGSEEMKLDTVEGCESLINEIHASTIPAEKKFAMLGPIGAQKRLLMRTAQAGGAN